MASTPTLPADPEQGGNVWCETCQLSLKASRARAHLASKRHAAAAGEPAAEARPKKKLAGAPEEPAAEARPKKKLAGAPAGAPVEAAPRARSRQNLPTDSKKEGRYWCGICEVSLTGAQAATHRETARHQTNEQKTLYSAMRNVRVSDE
jgi:hypothetical protein